MVSVIPQNANELIEQQLEERAKALENAFSADVLTFNGAMLFQVDDLIRNTVENVRRGSPNTKRLVVLLTSLGGYIEPVHRIVDVLRHHYDYVDFVVPNYAYSAGTLLAMSGDAIYMNYYSRLGPIDPQIEGSNGRVVSALGYLEQWNRLLKKANDGTLTTIEAELMIDGFDQAELYQFEQQRELSIALLQEWLVKYKFKDWHRTEGRGIPVTNTMRKRRARTIASMLNDTEKWHTHGYGISMEVLRRDLNLKIDDFDQDSRKVGDLIKDYHNLLSDYMVRRGSSGVVHAKGTYLPYA